MRSILSVLFCLLVSCQSKLVPLGPIDEKNLLFPFGVYKQKITVIYNEKENKFDGDLSSKEDSLSVYAFGPLGAKIFTLKENYTDASLDFETSIEAIGDKQPYIKKLYPVIRKIFLLRKDELEAHRDFEYNLDFPLSAVHVKFDFESSKVYRVFIEKKGYFSFIVNND